MNPFKVIIAGSLEFGSARSYEKVMGFFEHRVLNYYRNAILIKGEEVFDDTSYSISIPRFIKNEAPQKNWKNTINLLKYVNDFAIAGSIKVWVIQDRKLVEQVTIEPESDKVAVQSFLKGRQLVHVEGMEAEAMKALNRAIQKFERHSQAYERRGYINFQLRNYKDADYDFTKSININSNNPEPYWGRGNLRLIEEDYEGALADLALAVKNSIPHQSIYWKARRLKGDIYMKLEDYGKAAFEYKLFTKRNFKPDNPNYKNRQQVFYDYGKALLALGEYSEAINAFNAALGIEAEKNAKPPKADQYLFRGIARQKAGETGFVKDFKEAADLGSEKAVELLESIN